MKTLGERITELREMQKWSQAELARRVNIPQATISRIESNRIENPNPQILLKLAEIFDVSVDSLLGKKEQVVFRGYEKLSVEKRNMVKNFIKMLEK